MRVHRIIVASALSGAPGNRALHHPPGLRSVGFPVPGSCGPRGHHADGRNAPGLLINGEPWRVAGAHARGGFAPAFAHIGQARICASSSGGDLDSCHAGSHVGGRIPLGSLFGLEGAYACSPHGIV